MHSTSDASPLFAPGIERQSIEVDIACVGFGPAQAGFLTTLSRGLTNADGNPAFESKAVPGLPLQVICYERADDIGFGVSGLVTKGRGIRSTFPDLDPSWIPLASPVHHEEVLYLLDPMCASRRSAALRLADRLIRSLRRTLPFEHQALRLPYIPGFLRKERGLILSMGQFMQWVGAGLMGSGLVQIWPGMPVASPLIEGNRVAGVRLADQGTDAAGKPQPGFMPGMDIRAALTVVADGPMGAVGRQIDESLGIPSGHDSGEWAVGMKMVVDLREDCVLAPGTVLHTFGYPEPEIFGFLYVNAERVASLGIFVPSWFGNPSRSAYRYLQHWMLHPYLWRHLQGGKLRSWGAKSLRESGKRGEPYLAGNGYARIGEGSGSTNVLTGSGADEAWTTGTILAEGVLDLLKAGRGFTKEDLEDAYVRRRRASWVEKEARIAARSRDGFHWGVVSGLLGMGLAALSGGHLSIPAARKPFHRIARTVEDYFGSRLTGDQIEAARRECAARGTSMHDALMEMCGWPTIPHDGQLLVSQQDALLLGGKVQAPAGYADHILFVSRRLCAVCNQKTCIEVCSGEAITPGADGLPIFDREKCIHCGACVWNCTRAHPDDPDRTNIEFRAGAGGLHSAEN